MTYWQLCGHLIGAGPFLLLSRAERMGRIRAVHSLHITLLGKAPDSDDLARLRRIAQGQLEAVLSYAHGRDADGEPCSAISERKWEREGAAAVTGALEVRSGDRRAVSGRLRPFWPPGPPVGSLLAWSPPEGEYPAREGPSFHLPVQGSHGPLPDRPSPGVSGGGAGSSPRRAFVRSRESWTNVRVSLGKRSRNGASGAGWGFPFPRSMEGWERTISATSWPLKSWPKWTPATPSRYRPIPLSGTSPILYFGTEEQKKKWVPLLAQGTVLGWVRPHRTRSRIGCFRDPDPGRSGRVAGGA